jgi:hypothetical protein
METGMSELSGVNDLSIGGIQNCCLADDVIYGESPVWDSPFGSFKAHTAIFHSVSVKCSLLPFDSTESGMCECILEQSKTPQ